MLAVVHEETLGIVEFHEVGKTLFEGLHEETLGIAEIHKVYKNFLGVLHEVLIVVVLYEVDKLYLQVYSNLLHFRSLPEVVKKLPPVLRAVILNCRYLSDILHFYFAFDIFLYILSFSFLFLFHFCVPFYFIGYFSN